MLKTSNTNMVLTIDQIITSKLENKVKCTRSSHIVLHSTFGISNWLILFIIEDDISSNIRASNLASLTIYRNHGIITSDILHNIHGQHIGISLSKIFTIPIDIGRDVLELTILIDISEAKILIDIHSREEVHSIHRIQIDGKVIRNDIVEPITIILLNSRIITIIESADISISREL